MPPNFLRRMTARLSATPPEPTINAAKPTEEDLKQDQEVVQKAISDAVTAALNNDEFTKAVAVHLATQLQPTLKSALDISTVEENLNKRLDEIQTSTIARLSDLSNDLNNSKSTDKTAALEEAVAQINFVLIALGKDVKAVQEQIAQPDNTILSAHSTKLDGIATDLKTLQEKGLTPIGPALSSHTAKLDELATELKAVHLQLASPDTSLLSSHTTKLDAISAELVAVKENPETASALKNIISDIAAIKTDIETSTTSTDISGLSKKITSVQTIVEAQTIALSEIKAADSSSEIVASIKTSNNSHANHAAALSAIASQNTSADLGELKSQVAALFSAISEIKSADVSPEILSAVKASNNAHAAHATTLAEIKTATSTPAPVVEKIDLSTIETDVKTILTKLESQTTTLSEIKTVASTPAPAIEKTDISGLEKDVKTLLTTLESQTTTLSEIKTVASTPAPATEKTDISGLETDVKTILTNLESQTTTLSEIKTVASTPAPATEKTDISGLEKDVKTLLSNLESQSGALSDIKASSSGPEILAAIGTQDVVLGQLKDGKPSPEVLAAIEALKADIAASKAGISETQDSVKILIETFPKVNNDEVLAEFKAVKTAIAAIEIPKVDNAEVISEVKAVKTLVSEAKNTEILTEVKEIKVLVQKNAIATKVEEVGENDKGVEVKKENASNGVEVAEKEVEA